MLRRHFPILVWGREYSARTLASDLGVAVVVTIMLIPQSLAYAVLAGLPPQAGLYASILPLVPLLSERPLPRGPGERRSGGESGDAPPDPRVPDGGITFHLSEVKGPVMDRLAGTRFLEELTGAVHLTQYDAVASIKPELARRALEAPRSRGG